MRKRRKKMIPEKRKTRKDEIVEEEKAKETKENKRKGRDMRNRRGIKVGGKKREQGI